MILPVTVTHSKDGEKKRASNACKKKCYKNFYITQNGMSLKLECHSNWKVTQSWNVTQFGILLKVGI